MRAGPLRRAVFGELCALRRRRERPLHMRQLDGRACVSGRLAQREQHAPDAVPRARMPPELPRTSRFAHRTRTLLAARQMRVCISVFDASTVRFSVRFDLIVSIASSVAFLCATPPLIVITITTRLYSIVREDCTRHTGTLHICYPLRTRTRTHMRKLLLMFE